MDRSRHTRSITAFALALLLTAGVVWGLSDALGQSSSPSPASSGKITLQWGWYQNLDSLNPFIGYQNVSYDVYRLNYDFLVNYNPDTLQAEPGVAESWSHSADGKTWTFKIRHGITWQDGQPLTARDVAFTFTYVIKNQMSSYTTYTTSIKDVVALDDYTVQMNCTKPKAGILQMWVPIVPQHIWSKITPDDAQNKYQNLPPVIGSGPFQVVEWKKGQYVRLQAYKQYWGGAPKIDEIIFRIYTNQETEAAEMQQGNIQYASVAPAQFRQFTGKSQWTAHKAMGDEFDNMGINCYTGGPSLGNPVLKDARFRTALNWVIDRDKLAQIAYSSAAVPASGFLPTNYWKAPLDYHWQPTADQAYTYDPDKAKQLLDAAGYRDTNGDGVREYQGKPISLRLWAENEKNEYIVSSKLIADWLRGIGLKVTLQTMDDGALSDKLYNTVDGKFTPDYDLFVWGWGGDYDPGFLLSIFTTAQINGWSDCAWSDPQYDALNVQQDSELDAQKRKDIIWQMEQMVYDQTPYVVTVYPQTLEVYDSQRWDGWVQQPAGTGSVNNNYTFINVHPKASTAANSSNSKTVLIVIVAIAAAAVLAVLIVWLTRRGRAQAVED